MSELFSKINLKSDPDADADGGDDGDNEPVPEEESTATFTPLVQLEVVEVKTMEEDEEILHKQRAKLFLFGETMLDRGTGNKTWKERGVGDIKLLKHKENGRIRVLMRQDKTMKIIINHFLDPRIVIMPNAGSDKSWVWVAFDFSENELVETTFAVRFNNSDIANEFKAAFLKGQTEMSALLSGKDAAGVAADAVADSAADALATLTVKADGESTGDAAPAPAPAAAAAAGDA